MFCLLKVILFAIGLGIRRRNPESRLLAYAYAISLATTTAWLACVMGHSTNPHTFLYLFWIVFIGLLFFDVYFLLCAIACWTLVLGYKIVGEQLGLTPYAPLLARPPFGNGTIDMEWMVWQLSFGVLVTAVILFLCGYVIHRWRAREARVTELLGFLKKMFGRYLSEEGMNKLI